MRDLSKHSRYLSLRRGLDGVVKSDLDITYFVTFSTEV